MVGERRGKRVDFLHFFLSSKNNLMAVAEWSRGHLGKQSLFEKKRIIAKNTLLLFSL
jgi:hypothetical protein